MGKVGAPRIPMADRFWKHVDKCGPDECWEWTGARRKDGYGLIRADGRGPFLRAHRVSIELAGQELNDSDVVRHSCDNPPCVNPGHLFVGTQADNVEDMHTKKRHAYGDKLPNTKLTEDDVRAIRFYGDMFTHAEIASIYNVGRTCVTRILNGTRRKEVSA